MDTFEINIQRKTGDTWPVVVEQGASGAFLARRKEGTLDLGLVQLRREAGARDYGTVLGKALFRDDVRDAFTAALAQSEGHLHLLLFVEDQELRMLRWERLCVPVDGHRFVT